MLIKIGILLIFTALSFEIIAATSEVVCYHGTWSKYRTGNGTFTVSNIDPSLCTYLIYSFVGLNSTTGEVISLDTYLDDTLGNLEAFTSLKSSYSNLKVLVAIGGWNEGSVKYSTVAASSELRSAFIESALSYCQENNFDGFDVDWEYPCDRGGTSADKENFVTLLEELTTVFKANNLVVTVAVRAAATGVALSYDVPGISQYVDLIHVMTYDFHGSYDGVTGHNAPLYASSIDTTSSALELNVDAAITNWINQGANASKITLGIPLYGRSFTLSSTDDVALGATTSGAGTAGPYTQEAGYLGYNEIIEKQLAGGWTIVWDDEQEVPHMYQGDQWVGYDNEASVKLKVQYAISKGLAGVMVWSIETDDFLGLSGVKNPLLQAINDEMGNSDSGSDSTTSTTTNSISTASSTVNGVSTTSTTTNNTSSTSITTNSTSSTSTTASSSSIPVCTQSGYFRSSTNCSVYYYCSSAYSTPQELSCGLGLYYDTTNAVCNWSYLVDC
ncbi:acidic mammalian chitinase-like [Diorhabda sublineata]|uniref:acidic mammalian chitinase-like n=1 Tax=Diorhabda sublineata TaxID=1163346 RepID=UPI0024E1969D|nr:acidic mammalian chitinase-like [Diorhabda sublineata]XP_056647610.1 acidic mammalian chitinase-like [Diorhabda sublineata]